MGAAALAAAGEDVVEAAGRVLQAAAAAAEQVPGVEVVSADSVRVVAASGCPYPSAQHAELALRFAFALLDTAAEQPGFELPQWGRLRLQVRFRSVRTRPGSLALPYPQVGVHSGPVLGGVVGAKSREFVLMGESADVASRMCTASAPGRVHASDAVRFPASVAVGAALTAPASDVRTGGWPADRRGRAQSRHGARHVLAPPLGRHCAGRRRCGGLGQRGGRRARQGALAAEGGVAGGTRHSEAGGPQNQQWVGGEPTPESQRRQRPRGGGSCCAGFTRLARCRRCPRQRAPWSSGAPRRARCRQRHRLA